MAKKKKSNSESISRKKLTDLISFIGLLIAAIIFVLSQMNVGEGILRPILDAILFSIIAVKAFDYQKGKPVVYQILYWVSLVLVIVFIFIPIFQ